MNTIKEEVTGVLIATGITNIHPDLLEKLEQLAFVMWACSVNRRLLISRNQREGHFAGKRWVDDVKKLTRTGHHPANQFLGLKGKL